MILVTGSAGHLGEALIRMGRARGLAMRGVDLRASPFTDISGDLADPAVALAAAENCTATLHCATLHKPHVATHPRSAFVAANITATLNLLEAGLTHGHTGFVFTSTTSAFGAALSPPLDQPAAWITETVTPVPKNIYGATKTGAEDLCELYARKLGLPVIVLRISRFFPEPDDDPQARAAYASDNAKVNEFAFRRVDIEDAGEAHFLALAKAASLGFGRYIISAPTPFLPGDTTALRYDAPAVLDARLPGTAAAYARLGWRMFPGLDRVYDSTRAQAALGWQPRFTFAHTLAQASDGQPVGSDLARSIGIKGYHGADHADGLYPV